MYALPGSRHELATTIGRALDRPLHRHGLRRGDGREQVAELLAQVGLEPAVMDRHPHTLSGGQLQRASVARALALDPEILVCDEPVASLDVSVRAQILNLLLDLWRQRGIGVLFVTHDLGVVRRSRSASPSCTSGASSNPVTTRSSGPRRGIPTRARWPPRRPPEQRPGGPTACATDWRASRPAPSRSQRLPLPSPLPHRRGTLPGEGSAGSFLSPGCPRGVPSGRVKH